MPAKSPEQQRYMGMLYNCKQTGDCPSDEIKEKAKKIKMKVVRDFAGTKHEDIKKKKRRKRKKKSWLIEERLLSLADNLNKIKLSKTSHEVIALLKEARGPLPPPAWLLEVEAAISLESSELLASRAMPVATRLGGFTGLGLLVFAGWTLYELTQGNYTAPREFSQPYSACPGGCHGYEAQEGEVSYLEQRKRYELLRKVLRQLEVEMKRAPDDVKEAYRVLDWGSSMGDDDRKIIQFPSMTPQADTEEYLEYDQLLETEDVEEDEDGGPVNDFVCFAVSQRAVSGFGYYRYHFFSGGLAMAQLLIELILEAESLDSYSSLQIAFGSALYLGFVQTDTRPEAFDASGRDLRKICLLPGVKAWIAATESVQFSLLNISGGLPREISLGSDFTPSSSTEPWSWEVYLSENIPRPIYRDCVRRGALR